MTVWRWCWVTSGLVLLGAVSGSRGAWAQAGPGGLPTLEGPTEGAGSRADAPRVDAAAPEAGGPVHEAFQGPVARDDRVRAPKSPPPPMAEEPTNDRPVPQAQWVGGYWAWDPGRNDFVWVAGAWRIPPPGATWVAGRWMRDADGWYRVSGFWNRPRDRTGLVTTSTSTPVRPRWRTTGPPADHPDDTPTSAPGPDSFYVPGHYTPEGDRLNWRPGFWARVQPGWDWIPALGPPPRRLGIPPGPLEPRPGRSRAATARRDPARPRQCRRCLKPTAAHRRVGAGPAGRRRGPPPAAPHRSRSRPDRRGGAGCPGCEPPGDVSGCSAPDRRSAQARPVHGSGPDGGRTLHRRLSDPLPDDPTARIPLWSNGCGRPRRGPAVRPAPPGSVPALIGGHRPVASGDVESEGPEDAHRDTPPEVDVDVERAAVVWEGRSRVQR